MPPNPLAKRIASPCAACRFATCKFPNLKKKILALPSQILATPLLGYLDNIIEQIVNMAPTANNAWIYNTCNVRFTEEPPDKQVEREYCSDHYLYNLPKNDNHYLQLPHQDTKHMVMPNMSP